MLVTYFRVLPKSKMSCFFSSTDRLFSGVKIAASKADAIFLIKLGIGETSLDIRIGSPYAAISFIRVSRPASFRLVI